MGVQIGLTKETLQLLSENWSDYTASKTKALKTHPFKKAMNQAAKELGIMAKDIDVQWNSTLRQLDKINPNWRQDANN